MLRLMPRDVRQKLFPSVLCMTGVCRRVIIGSTGMACTTCNNGMGKGPFIRGPLPTVLKICQYHNSSVLLFQEL